jgi:hypothetical protein
VLAGPPLRKLLFMTDPEQVEAHLKPHWQAALTGTGAETMQAVPDMLGECSCPAWLGLHVIVRVTVLLADWGLHSCQLLLTPCWLDCSWRIAEVVPSGWDKWRSIVLLLEHLGTPASNLVAIGDGSNDLGMVSGAGMGVAMGNAVPSVKKAAQLVVADNDSDGVADAIERLFL